MKLLKAITLIAAFVLLSTTVFSQGQANVWLFGTHAGLDFNTTPPTLITTGRTNAGTSGAGAEGEGYASVSDASGNLLFYTDGTNLWNAAGTVVTTALSGALSAAQAAIIVPRPSTPNRYYVFTVGVTGSTTGIYYNEVNATSGTAVTMISTNNALWTGVRTMESLCAIPHSNSTDYWLVGHGDNASNQFRAFPVTSTGVGASVNSSVGYSANNGQGIMKVNSCFTKIAISYGGQPGGNAGGGNRVEVLDFNNTTGVVSNPITIDNFTASKQYGPYGVEFSPNGNYLFVSELMMAQVFRYDISSGVTATIEASRTLIGTGPHGANIDNGVQSFPRMGHLQIGPDGVIYIANHNAWHYWDGSGCVSCSTSGIISTITNPDGGGTFTATAYTFPGTYATGAAVSHGLPTLLRSFISGNVTIDGPSTLCPGVSGTFTTSFGGVMWSGAGNHIEWIWGDNGTTVQNANQLSANHTYASTGTYTITVRIRDNCSRWWSSTKVVEVPPALDPAITCGSGNPPTLNGPNANIRWFDDDCGGTQVGSGTSYTMPTFPGTIWVEDQTGVTTNTAVATTPTFNYPYSARNTDFTLTEPTTIRTVRFSQNTDANPGCGGSLTVSINSMPGNTPMACMSKTFTSGFCNTDIALNFNLPAGSYRLVASLDGRTATAYTTASNSAISVNTGGPFYQIATQTYNECAPRKQINVNNALCPSLPVTLVQLDAEVVQQQVRVYWATAVEINNSHFIVERSLDGINFTPIGRVNGRGTVNTLQSYEYYDVAFTGTIYYRLVQFDIDGTAETSDVVSVNVNNGQELIVSPNPFSGELNILLNVEASAQIKITDITGREVYTIVKEASGSLTITPELLPGTYLLNVITADKSYFVKIVRE